ncbi:Rad9-like Rad53-binding [Apiospora kogelbergensis]|uniref:Rad9-like Rad53-binding n=1 Tax=Apiospora kogelbergensis TaxID=1337665 RepID=A0AAW0QZ26_9PEZI
MELGTQGSQPIFDQYHKTYGEILTRFPAKDIRKQYESQTSHTSIEPDDGSFSQDDTGAVNFNLEPFQLHDGVRTSSGDVDESIETGSVFENPRDDPMLPTLQTQPNCRPERSRVSLEPATNPRHSGGSCSLEVDHDPQESLVGNEGQDSDLDLDWANTFRHRRLAKRRQERAAASLGRIRFPRPTAKIQKYTKALLADRVKAKIQNCTSKRQKQTNAKISVNDNGKGVFGVVQGNLSKSEDCNTPGPSAGEDRTLETDAQNPYSYTDSQTATPVSLLSTEGSSKSKERISGTASPGAPQAPRRQSPSDQSVRAASRHRTHQWTEDQDPITMVESYLLPVGDGTGNGTDTRTPWSSIPKLANKRTRSLRPTQPAKGPLGGVSASSGLFKGMVFALSFNSEDEAAKQLTKSLIQRASGKILVTGFDELFEPACLGLPLDLSPSTAARSLALKSNFQATSFTALIADSHSRKANKLQERAYAKAGVNDKKIGASGIAQDSLSKSESGNTNGRSAGEDQMLRTDVHNTSSHTDPPTGTPVALPSTDDTSRSKARIYVTAPPGESPTARRQIPTVDSMRAASRHRKHQQIEDQDPMAKVEDNLLPAGDGTGKATDTRTQRSSTSSREWTDERTRSLRSAQPTKSPRAGAFASSDLFQGMVFALSFSSHDEAEKRFTESVIQRASEAIFVY